MCERAHLWCVLTTTNLWSRLWPFTAWGGCREEGTVTVRLVRLSGAAGHLYLQGRLASSSPTFFSMLAAARRIYRGVREGFERGTRGVLCLTQRLLKPVSCVVNIPPCSLHLGRRGRSFHSIPRDTSLSISQIRCSLSGRGGNWMFRSGTVGVRSVSLLRRTPCLASRSALVNSEILSDFYTRGPVFSFCSGLYILPIQSC